MSRRSLPESPDTERLRAEAKALLRAFRAGDPDASARFATTHPEYRRSADARVQLSDALWVIAREYGFGSWVKMKDYVESGARELRDTIAADDIRAIERLLRRRPEYTDLDFAHGGNVCPLTAYVHRVGGSVEALRAVIAIGGDIHDLDRELFGMCEDHNLEQTRKLLAVGVDPNDAYNDGWDCHVLLGWVQTYWRGDPDRLHEGVNLLIDHGARFEDSPVWDIHRGHLDRLEGRLRLDPDLVHARFQLDYGNYVTLRGVTLLHVAVEYNELAAAALLLRHGADIDARAQIGRNGVGGQTPLFHAIGSNQGGAFPAFEYLLARGADLATPAHLQAGVFCEDPVHKGRDHFFDEVRSFTPMSYATLINDHHPEWREASREAAALRRAGT